MRVAVTGTPGTGKTTATARAALGLEVIHLNDVIREAGLSTGTDPERGSLLADVAGLRDRFSDHENVCFESHLAHHLEVDRVVVLRCHPRVLCERLLDRGDSERKASENAEAEALDVILTEAVDRHGLESVYEIDTTDRDPAAVAAELEAVVAGERPPSAGEVDYLEYL